jgi:hypothetical protein
LERSGSKRNTARIRDRDAQRRAAKCKDALWNTAAYEETLGRREVQAPPTASKHFSKTKTEANGSEEHRNTRAWEKQQWEEIEPETGRRETAK